MRQLPQPKFQAAVAAGDARAAAVAAVQALEVAVTAAMANIERASAGQGAEYRREKPTQRRLKSPLHLGQSPPSSQLRTSCICAETDCLP